MSGALSPADYQRLLQSAGLCRRCRRPAQRRPDGTVRPYCADCRAKATAGERRRYAAKAAALPTPAELFALYRQLRQAVIESGLCVACGAPLPNLLRALGVVHCQDCEPNP